MTTFNVGDRAGYKKSIAKIHEISKSGKSARISYPIETPWGQRARITWVRLSSLHKVFSIEANRKDASQ